MVGGGPAGLTAAIYLARYHLRILVIEDGRSRAATIPLTRNHAGFPDGISGVDLLGRMRAQAELYGVAFRHGCASALVKDTDGFSVALDGERISARTILLATGVVNRRPAMNMALHDEAVANGQIRYCPVCDAYEITDKSVAVIGTGDQGVEEAVFLRSYTDDVTLVSPNADHRLTADHVERLNRFGIRILTGPVERFELGKNFITVSHAEGRSTFASIYPALGSDIRSELTTDLDLGRTAAGCLKVDSHQRTDIHGLYAAGDVVLGLDQMSHAMGQAAVAATAIRNDLSETTALLRRRAVGRPSGPR
ncbi:NAD(P)/FAD-dependent oxidoreductase [Rhizobium sp. CG5]|nr:NAD(P)/FAD-dependent oxidoreductase [Rhizobium sp. CG5]